MFGLTALSLGSGLGNNSPSIAFNPQSKEYLVLYVKNDAGCGKERLFARVIDAISGTSTGNDIAIGECNNSIMEPALLFNATLNEYIIFFKSIGSIGNKSNLLYCAMNADDHVITHAPVSVDSDGIGDPFRGLGVSQDGKNNLYALSYHKVTTAGESSLVIKYLNANTKSVLTQQTNINKSDFGTANNGLFGSKLVFNGNHFMVIFELKLVSGSEIWGIMLNPVSGLPVNEFFRLSPEGATENYFINPAAILNPASNEVLFAFEKSYYTDPDGAFRVSKDIILRKASATSGALTSTSDVYLPSLPGNQSFDEDKKLPTLSISELSQELLVSFYGLRFAAGTDRYNLLMHRFNLGDLSPIGDTSTTVISAVGTQVVENESLKAIGFVHNAPNNQFGLTRIKDSDREINSQIWRYDNNPPSNLRITSSSRDENMPTGSVFTVIRADDPDPEDAMPTFSLVSGEGSADNSFFYIEDSNLKIAENLNYEASPSRTVRIRATDSHAAFTEKNFILTINDINEPPYDILLAGDLSIEENSLDFSSTISVLDEDAGDMHTLALVAGDSSVNNAYFQITNGNVLQLKSPLDYEETPIAYIRIRATDLKGLSMEKAFSIYVIDVNEPMDSMYLSPSSLPENDPDAFVNVIIVDPDADQNYIITLTRGEGDDDNTSFTVVDHMLMANHAFDYEKKNVYKVRIKAQEGDYSVSKSFRINVIDVNDPPDSIRISSNQIMDGRGAGYAIGKIFTFDQDEGDKHQLSLLTGADLFTIDTNDSLITKIPLLYNYNNPAANFYDLTIRSEDLAGAAITWDTKIEVIPFSDTEAPQLLNFENNPQYVLSDSHQNFTISVSAVDNEKMEDIHFYYRKIRADQPFEISNALNVMQDNEKFFRAEITMNTRDMDELGVEYYFQAVDASGNTSVTSVSQTYRSYNTREFTPTSKTYNGDQVSYKIITNPYQSVSPNRVSKIFSDYGSSSDKTWRLFSYNGGNNIEVGNSTSALMHQGEGFWFNKMPKLDQAIYLESAQSPANHQSNEALIQLKKGWNLIGNPYPFVLDWNQVRNQNDLSSNELILYTYDQQYKESARLEVFEGGFVYALSETSITIPVTDIPNSSGRLTSMDDQGFDWYMNLSIENKEIKNDLAGIGMHQDARPAYDHFDRPRLPRFISYADIAFEQPNHIFGQLSRDITSSSGEYIWQFVASSNATDRQFRLSWDAPSFDLKSKNLLLYDFNHDILIDMTQEQEYNVDLSQPVAFKVIYGNQSFIESAISGIKITASSPFPNPFRNDLSISIMLPELNSDYEVSYDMYNLLGERVINLNQERMMPGAHTIQWQPENSLQNGIYIYSIKIKNQFLTKEFHGRIVKN